VVAFVVLGSLSACENTIQSDEVREVLGTHERQTEQLRRRASAGERAGTTVRPLGDYPQPRKREPGCLEHQGPSPDPSSPQRRRAWP
jgi:hypothetical protein